MTDATPNDELPDHVAENRRYWDGMADQWVAAGERSWASADAHWGIWGVPESEVGMLPPDMTSMRAIELGCGTGYGSAWMARRGAEVVGIDNSARQLDTARRLAAQHGMDITFVHGNAETVDAPGGSFDFTLSEYGAAIWCDPYLWIPEAHRLLAPGGRLHFLGNTPLSLVCMAPDGSATTTTLNDDYFGMHRFDWREVEVEPEGVEFNLSLTDWFRLFADVGFAVEHYTELRCPPDHTGPRFTTSAEWARRYPAEQVWFLRKR